MCVKLCDLMLDFGNRASDHLLMLPWATAMQTVLIKATLMLEAAAELPNLLFREHVLLMKTFAQDCAAAAHVHVTGINITRTAFATISHAGLRGRQRAASRRAAGR
jgi:hypothetical protein